MNSPQLIDRLAGHRTLSGVPAAQLQWLASHGVLRQFAAGDVVVHRGDPIVELFVILSGHLRIGDTRGAAARKLAEWKAGDVSGFLPYSRMAGSPGYVLAMEPSEVLSVDRSHFAAMICDCHELTSALVHVMLDRARWFRSNELHDEKMASLGRLAARLAHELNNPASAVARSAKNLLASLHPMDDSSRTLGAAGLTAPQTALVARLRDVASAKPERAQGPLALVEREDEIAAWLTSRQLDSVEADSLAATALGLGDLNDLASVLDGRQTAVALRYLLAVSTVNTLAQEIETAASRIHALVAAVKGFTYMDQAAAPKSVDIGRGLLDTLTVFGSKARLKSIDLRLDIEPGLPAIVGFGGELNQIWANLIDNAIEAVPPAGQVKVAAARHQQSIVVRVVDNGPGVPEAIRDRIFEPFFTTKPVGEGTGLGLDIVRRLVNRHDGSIELDTEPGRTEFRVTLPIAAAPAAGSPDGT